MKKVLFYSVLAVLAAGCAENELDSLSVATQGEGISFEAEEAPATRMQWDETETSYVPFWYAEQDRIGIFAVNVKKGAFGSEADLTGRMLNNWSGLPATASAADATYKATQSQRTGAFTSEDDNSLLHFNGNKEARFLGVYPKNVKAAYASGKVTLSELPKLTEQTQTTTKGYNEATLMYSMSVASKENSYDAVGEKVNLQFKRPLAALVFSTENADDYTTGDNSVFGNLKTITVEAAGWTPAAGVTTTAIPGSELAYDPNNATLEVDTVNYAATLKPGTVLASNAGKTVKLTLNDANGLAWSDADLAIASIMPVDRSKNFSADKPELMKVVFSFDKIDLPLERSTSKSWSGYIEYPALDIEAFPYLVTKGAGNTRTLIVNSGAFSDIYDENGNIDWTDTQSGSNAVAVTEIQTIISKVALTNEELAKIKDFTALKNLTLAENTSIPANTFTTTQAGNMLKLDLPKVTSVDKKFIANKEADGTTYAFSKITDLLMPKYEFEDEVVNKAFFNSKEQSELVNIDVSGVRSMMPKFGILRTLAFTNYSALETVKVQDNMVVSPSGFAGCLKLEEIDGVVDISEAPKAFWQVGGGAAYENSGLASIELTNGIIPDDAFRCCVGLEEVKSNGAAIVPTSIGARAFEWTGIKYMDLSKVTTLGKSAFANSKIYSANKDTQILTVGATELPEAAFKGCLNLQIVKFTNATKITGDNVFDGATAMRQIKFLKTISLADGTYTAAGLFGTSANIDLWTNPSQSGVNGLTWTLSAKKDSSANANVEDYNFTFKSIQKKIED